MPVDWSCRRLWCWLNLYITYILALNLELCCEGNALIRGKWSSKYQGWLSSKEGTRLSSAGFFTDLRSLPPLLLIMWKKSRLCKSSLSYSPTGLQLCSLPSQKRDSIAFKNRSTRLLQTIDSRTWKIPTIGCLIGMFAKDLPNLGKQSDDQDTPTSRQIILIEGEYIYYS